MKSLGIMVLATLVWVGARAQTVPAPVRARVIGTVISVDAASAQITLKTDQGVTVTVKTTEKSFLLRLPPGETDAKKATPVGLSEIAAGDRVAASGQFAPDQKSFEARTVLVLTKAAVAEVTELASITVPLATEQSVTSVNKLIDALEDHDDVKEVYSNAELPD